MSLAFRDRLLHVCFSFPRRVRSEGREPSSARPEGMLRSAFHDSQGWRRTVGTKRTKRPSVSAHTLERKTLAEDSTRKPPLARGLDPGPNNHRYGRGARGAKTCCTATGASTRFMGRGTVRAVRFPADVPVCVGSPSPLLRSKAISTHTRLLSCGILLRFFTGVARDWRRLDIRTPRGHAACA